MLCALLRQMVLGEPVKRRHRPPSSPQRGYWCIQHCTGLILATDKDTCRARTFGINQRYRKTSLQLYIAWRNERKEGLHAVMFCHLLVCLGKCVSGNKWIPLLRLIRAYSGHNLTWEDFYHTCTVSFSHIYILCKIYETDTEGVAGYWHTIFSVFSSLISGYWLTFFYAEHISN